MVGPRRARWPRITRCRCNRRNTLDPCEPESGGPTRGRSGCRSAGPERPRSAHDHSTLGRSSSRVGDPDSITAREPSAPAERYPRRTRPHADAERIDHERTTQPDKDPRQEAGQEPVPRHAQPAQDAVRDEGEPGAERAGQPQALDRRRALSPNPGQAGRSAAVRVPRRAAVRQRLDPHGTPDEQVSQGFRGSQPDHDGHGLPVRAGVGLPRAADRAQGDVGAGRVRQDREAQGAR